MKNADSSGKEKGRDTIYGMFKRQVELQPDAVAVIDGHKRYTYAQLDALACGIAANFEEEPTRVGIVMSHGVKQIAAMLAVLKSGAAYVPAEPSFPEERIMFMMRECDVDFVLTDSLRARPSAKNADLDLSRPEGTAYILYTSGSTGLPKGVMVSNANVCHYVRAFHREFDSGPGDVMLQYSVCSFDIFVEEVFTTLLSGAALAIPKPKVKASIPKLMEYVEREKVTIISGFPYLLLELNKLPGIPKSLRLLISGGDVLRARFVDRLIPQTVVYNTYGPSETTVCCSYFRCNGTEPLADGTYPIGRPVLGAGMRILDEEMRPVANGAQGEICITGGGVSQGYVGKREQRAFVTLPDGERMYRSGDLGIRRADGEFLFLRRKDSQVMILGKRVEPGEVQNVLNKCPEVESGVVRSFTDRGGLSYLTAYVVPKNKRRFSLKELKRRMAKFLPSYMIPEFFVRLASMPLTANGKVDAKRLPVKVKG